MADQSPSVSSEPQNIAELVHELSTLSSVLLSTDSLDRVVWEAAMLAVRSVDDIAGCGVTVLRDGAMTSIMPGVAPYGQLENLQYENNAGPVPQAMNERRTILVSHGDAQGWPAYAQMARELSVTASLVTPLQVGDEVLGAVSMYADAATDLGEARAFAELVADLAATALSCMTRQAEQTKLSEDLRTALDSRAVIEQAKGVLLARGHTLEQGFGVLRRSSQNHNIKLREIAAIVVETSGGPTAHRS